MHETPPFFRAGVFYISVFPENRATWQNIPFAGQPVGGWKNKQACIGRF